MLYYLVMKSHIKRQENKVVLTIRVLLLIVLLPVVLIYLIIKLLKNTKRKKADKEKICIYNISQLDSISGRDFELLLKDIFERLGYTCQLTKKSHDFGADLVIEKGKSKAIVQAKCYTKTVGVKAIQEIVSAKNHYNVYDTIVATNNYFSKEATLLATENNVMLIDRDVLAGLIKQTEVKVSTTETKFSCFSSVEKAKITAKYPYSI